MHTATQLAVSMFELTVDNILREAEDVFGEWRTGDRLAVIVDSAFGAVGAAMYVQCWTAWFYANNPDAVAAIPRYADVYLLHLGGVHGDHSYYDYWPTYKERTNLDGYSVLDAIDASRITHLLVPAAVRFPTDAHFSVANTIREHVRKVAFYDASGAVESNDLTIGSRDPATRENTLATLDPAKVASALEVDAMPTPDLKDWATRFKARAHEVPEPQRLAALEQFRARANRAEQYRQASIEDLLSAGTNGEGKMAELSESLLKEPTD